MRLLSLLLFSITKYVSDRLEIILIFGCNCATNRQLLHITNRYLFNVCIFIIFTLLSLFPLSCSLILKKKKKEILNVSIKKTCISAKTTTLMCQPQITSSSNFLSNTDNSASKWHFSISKQVIIMFGVVI